RRTKVICMEEREQQLKEIEQKLRNALDESNSELAELDQQLQQLGDDTELSSGVDNHPGDESDKLYEQERLLTLRESFTDRKADIEHALSKFDEGTYGICERCGRQIADARLEAIPFARYCRDCQEILD